MVEKVDFNRAKEEARNIIKKMDINYAPVLIDDIIKNNGIEIKYRIFPEKSASGFIDIKEKCIYINYNDGIARQNFTKAHELGHYILHKYLFLKEPNKQVLLREENIDDTNSKEEKEANCFAAEILIPEHILFNQISRLKIQEKNVSVENLATSFCVSIPCMTNRINSLNWR
jgi:Zn-dependent peptidase ImmA (M78 family)